MITIELMGGLGNQLFQIFTTISYAIENGSPFVFPKVDKLTCGTTRPTYWQNIFSSLQPFLKPPSELNYQLYREPTFSYRPLPVLAEKFDIKLYGYFQSSKYFHRHKNLICQILKIDQQLRQISEQYHTCLPEEHIAIHFRITGYRELPDFHPLCTENYYKSAIQYCLGRCPLAKFMVFCQPEDHAEVNSIMLKMGVNYSFSPDAEDWQQLLLMACCQGHIIANSSFSWWAAYLAESKMVVYPKVWFGQKGPQDVNDLPEIDWCGR